MLVTIVIVTFNGLEHTKRCVESILSYTPSPPYELIFVDNGSADGTVDYLETLLQATIIRNAENRGFPAAANQGIRAARGEYILLLNNDVIVTPGWLERLVAHAERDDRVGAVGPMSDGTGEIQRDDFFSGKIGGREELLRHAAGIATFNRGQGFEFHRIAGFCMLLKREAIETVGGLDEGFGIGFYEDDDLCLRMRQAGYRIMVAADIFVHHEIGVSFDLFRATSGWPADLQLQINRTKFLDKWFRRPRLSLDTQGNAGLQPLVSILMPTLNRRGSLSRALQSVLDQSYPYFEVIVVNDGGESVEDIIQQLGDQRLIYIDIPHAGKSKALNMAIQAAKGDLIAYLDDDDIYYPWHLETLVAAYLENPSRKVLYSDIVLAYSYWEPSGEQVFIGRGSAGRYEYSRPRLMQTEVWWCPPNLSVMHEKSLFRRAGLFDESLDALEDWELLRRFSLVTDFFHVPVFTGEYVVNIQGQGRNALIMERDARQRLIHYITHKPTVAGRTYEDAIVQGIGLERQALWLKAADVYASILQEEPAHPIACEHFVMCLDRVGQYRLSEPCLRRLVEKRPDYFPGVMLYARLCVRLQNFEKAKEMLQLALLVNPSEVQFSPEIYTVLSQCYEALGINASAHACRMKARRLSGDYRIADPFEGLRRFRYYLQSEGVKSTLRRTSKALAQHLRFARARRG